MLLTLVSRYGLVLIGLVSFATLFISANASELAMNNVSAMSATSIPDAPPEISQVVVRKEERKLYLLSGDEVVRSYQISLGENPVGHKLFEGDERTPEGEYVLDWRNSNSDFYKSIHISYPNARDVELASAWGLDPGGSIMIHGVPNEAGDFAFAYMGLDWTNGCIAVSNDEMDEIWRLVSDGTPIQILP